MELPSWWPKGLKHEDYFNDMLEKGRAYQIDLSINFPGPETANEL
jgi:hypothetical protein